MASIKFIRDASRTHATSSGRGRVERIPRGTVFHDLKQSSANWWVAKGDAVHIKDDNARPGGRSSAVVPPAMSASPFTGLLQGLEDGDYDRVFDAFRNISAEDIEALPNVTADSKMILEAARAEVEASGDITTVALPDLIDAAREAAKPVQAAPALLPPLAPAAPKKGAGRPKKNA